MENLRMKMRNHPLPAAIITLFVILTGSRLLSSLFGLLPEGPLFDSLSLIASIIYTFVMVNLCGYGWVYKQRGLRRTLFVTLPHFILYGLVAIVAVLTTLQNPDMVWVSKAHIFSGILFLLEIGFYEESIFRGIIVNLLAEKGLKTRKDIFKVVFLSGLLFGVAHMSNTLTGVTIYSAMFQSIGAFAGGCLLAAYYLRGGSLWALMLLHSVQDTSGLFDQVFTVGGNTNVALNEIGPSVVIPAALFLLITLFLLRKSGCRKIIAQRAKQFPMQ